MSQENQIIYQFLDCEDRLDNIIIKMLLEAEDIISVSPPPPFYSSLFSPPLVFHLKIIPWCHQVSWLIVKDGCYHQKKCQQNYFKEIGRT